MSQFDFVMMFYNLLLGLAVAQLLSGFANLLRAPLRPELGWLTPLTGTLLLAEIMAAFFDAFSKLQSARLDFAGMALPTLIGMLYFVCAVIVVPAAHDECPALDDYFMRQRRWTIGAIALASLATIPIELSLVADLVRTGRTFGFVYYLVTNAIPLATLVVVMVARSRRLIAWLIAFNIVFLVWLYSPLSFPLFSPH